MDRSNQKMIERAVDSIRVIKYLLLYLLLYLTLIYGIFRLVRKFYRYIQYIRNETMNLAYILFHDYKVIIGFIIFLLIIDATVFQKKGLAS